MKIFATILICILLFTNCSSMEFFFDKTEADENTLFQNPNPKVTEILTAFENKIMAQTLQSEDFWALMESSTDMGSCFLGEFIASTDENQICLIFMHLIKFGTQDKNKFYHCITSCTGIDGITPINELIRRMPENYSANSNIIKIFLKLLDLIKTLDKQQQIDILNQRELYGTHPVLTAAQTNKKYIVEWIAEILAPQYDKTPNIQRWDGMRFLSPDVKL